MMPESPAPQPPPGEATRPIKRLGDPPELEWVPGRLSMWIGSDPQRITTASYSVRRSHPATAWTWMVTPASGNIAGQ